MSGLQLNTIADCCNNTFVLFCRTQFQNWNNTSYGIGAYFAKSAIYPHVIRPHNVPDQNIQLILANVVLGICKDYGYDKAPYTNAREPDGYHSVTGTENNMAFVQKWIDDERRKTFPSQSKLTNYQTLLSNGAEYGRQYVVHRSIQTYPSYLVTYKV